MQCRDISTGSKRPLAAIGVHAPARQFARSRRRSTGFTIVELLIVIVVIGILAAITIVAYNGVQQRARAATVSSDLRNAAEQLKMDQVDTGNYPATLDAANGGAGVKASSGTTYQYSVNNSTNPQTFCITGTNGTTSYFVTQASAPTAGGCPGHGQGGVAAVTNLVTNPSFEVGTSGWYCTACSMSTDSTTEYSGNSSVRFQHNGTAQDNYLQSNTTPATSGQTYTGSEYIRKSGATSSVTPWLIFFNSSGSAVKTAAGPSVSLSPSTDWTRISSTATAPAGTVSVSTWVGVGQPDVSDTFYVDAALMTQGTSLYQYADGSSPNWVWNGTPNSSTSTGPAK